jgi:hypothetical protein
MPCCPPSCPPVSLETARPFILLDTGINIQYPALQDNLQGPAVEVPGGGTFYTWGTKLSSVTIMVNKVTCDSGTATQVVQDMTTWAFRLQGVTTSTTATLNVQGQTVTIQCK